MAAFARVGAKQANVVVVTYDPVIEAEDGKRLTAVMKRKEPAKLTRDVIGWIYVADFDGNLEPAGGR